MKYIAYGSNMSREQMKYRCPDAKLVGTGFVHGARLEFRGRTGNAHATLVPDQKFGRKVPVAVWELSNQDEQYLDRYEGYPHYYSKEVWQATLSNGRAITGLIYLMNGQQINRPSDAYYSSIRDAYISLGLASYLPILEQALEAATIWDAL